MIEEVVETRFLIKRFAVSIVAAAEKTRVIGEIILNIILLADLNFFFLVCFKTPVTLLFLF